MIVTHAHFRSIPARRGSGYCNSGGRTWFARHGFDWTNFVKHGIEETKLAATGDGMALNLVAWAHQCEGTKRTNG